MKNCLFELQAWSSSLTELKQQARFRITEERTQHYSHVQQTCIITNPLAPLLTDLLNWKWSFGWWHHHAALCAVNGEGHQSSTLLLRAETSTKEESTNSARIITGLERTCEEHAQTFGKVQVILRKFHSRISSICDAHFIAAVTVFQHLAWRPTPANLDIVSSFLSTGHTMSRAVIKALDKVEFIVFQLKEWFRRLKSHLNGHRARH